MIEFVEHGLRNLPDEGPELVCFGFASRHFLSTCGVNVNKQNMHFEAEVDQRAEREPPKAGNGRTHGSKTFFIVPQVSNSSQ